MSLPHGPPADPENGLVRVRVISGLALSFHYDLPTGPLMVCKFGLAVLASVLRRGMGRATAG